MAIDSDVLNLAPANAFEVEYSEIQGKVGHALKTKFLDSLQCTDKSYSAIMTTRLDSLRRPATVAIADGKFEIKSLKEIKGAGDRAAIKRVRSTRSRSTATSKVGGRPRVGGIETELKHSFPRIKEWR
ncbi:hypothetical protein H9P43_003274 [Blastocladiella emersonii ATCC 22665]|nr:hypothetical protein H9P43_003274 [Blastocladiella emersonii ATCC 22665]